MNEDKGTRYRRAERGLRVLEVGAAGLALLALAVSPVPRALAARAMTLAGPAPSSTTVVSSAAAGLVLAVSLSSATLAALPFALRRRVTLARRYHAPATTARAHVRAALRHGVLIVLAGSAGWWIHARFAAVAPWLAGPGLAVSAVVIAGLVMWLAPWAILLSPRVRPLRDEAVTGRLHALASRANLRLAGIHEWVFDSEGDHANAALVGVIGPRRLLISDTLLAGCPPEEVDAVVAHELGHHAHGHTWQRVRDQASAVALAIAGAELAGAGPARWFGGTGGLRDPASLPWMLIGAGVVWLATRPWQLAQSRRHEAEADAFALSLTGRPDVLERVLVRLGARNLSSDDESLLTRAFFLTHPPIPARIAAARRASEPARAIRA